MLSNSYLEKSADNSKKFDAKTILALGGFTKNLKSSLESANLAKFCRAPGAVL